MARAIREEDAPKENGPDLSRRKALKKLASAGAAFLGAGLGLESIAEALELPEAMPKQFTRETLPLPELNFDALSEQEQETLGRIFLENTLIHTPANIASYDALPPHEKRQAADNIFRRHELDIRFARNTLLGWGDILNNVQKQDLTRFKQNLAQHGIVAPDWDDLIATVERHKHDKKYLYQLYRGLVGLYDRNLSRADTPAQKESVKPAKTEAEERPPSAIKAVTHPDHAQNKEIRPGVFVDEDGIEFSWGHERKNGDAVRRKYYRPDEEITHDKLCSFEGRKRNGKSITIKLRRDACDAWNAMAKDAKAEGITLEATEGFRTMGHQREMRKKFGIGAAIPGESEHHLGTTVDIREAWDSTRYRWLVGNDSSKTPRCVQYGFVPTVVREVWHFRYVGEEAALAFWKKNGAKVIESHTRRLR